MEQKDEYLLLLRGGGGGGGGGIQAYNFGNFDYEIRVEGEGQDTSRLFWAGFGSMRTFLPMLGLGAKMGPNTKILTKRDRALIWRHHSIRLVKQSI